MSNHPDYDYPCNRVFWEDDTDYSRRRQRMNTLKASLVALETSQRARSELIYQGNKWIYATKVLLDATQGELPDRVHTDVVNSWSDFRKYLDGVKSRYQTYSREIQACRKELSELTR